METLPEVLNTGLAFSMEFGENWLKPINGRLLEIYPHLKEDELCQYNLLCEEVNKTGNDFVRESFVKVDGEIELVRITEFKKYMIKKYDWVHRENLQRLYSQSCYYALK